VRVARVCVEQGAAGGKGAELSREVQAVEEQRGKRRIYSFMSGDDR
jgi:hypothetical protein